jgi:hypothetical protein
MKIAFLTADGVCAHEVPNPTALEQELATTKRTLRYGGKLYVYVPSGPSCIQFQEVGEDAVFPTRPEHRYVAL